jgi:hypothetical protein
MDTTPGRLISSHPAYIIGMRIRTADAARHTGENF